MPCLHSPVVGAMVPSASMMACSKNAVGCCRQTFRRLVDGRPSGRQMSAVSKRRQKSPAVVGSGMRWAPRASRKASSLRSSSRSSMAGAAGQDVVGQVQHVVGLVVGQVPS